MADYILTVEDDEGIRQLIETLLSREDYQVVGAADGQTALTLVTQHPPALILLDMQLPRMNGHEFLTRLRAQTKQPIPIVIVTVDHLILSSQDAKLATDVLIKPFTVDELLAAVRKCLRST